MTTKKQMGMIGVVALLAAAGSLAVWFAWPKPMPPVEQVEAPPEAVVQPPTPKPKMPDAPEDLEARGKRVLREMSEWYKWLDAELKASTDPVAVAIRASKEKEEYRVLVAIQILRDHWEDPRSEVALAEVAAQPFKLVPSCEYIPATGAYGLAAAYRDLVRAKKDYRDLLKGAETNKEKLTRIRAFFATPRDWDTAEKKGQGHLFVLKDMLLETVMEIGEGDDFDLVLKWVSVGSFRYRGEGPNRDTAFFVKHADLLLNHAKKLGREKAMSEPRVYGKLVAYVPREKLSPLLEEWLSKSTNKEEIRELLSVLWEKKPVTREQLLAMLHDPRPAIVGEAVLKLHSDFPDKESLRAIRDTAERRKQAGADPKELSQFAHMVRFFEQDFATQELKETKDDSLVPRLVAKLAEGPFSAGRLLPLLRDPRPVVVREAISWLAEAPDPRFDESDVRTIRKAAEVRRQAKASEAEMARWEAAIRVIESRLADPTKGVKKP